MVQAQTWTKSATGQILFDHVRAWVRCEIIERIQARESTALITRSVQSLIECKVQPGETGRALVYYNRTWHHLGERSRLDR